MLTRAEVVELCRGIGADMAGVAEVGRFGEAPAATHPAAVLPSCASVIVLGCAFPRAILSATTAEYTALRNSMAEKVSALARDVAARFVERGFEALPVDALAVTGVHGGRYCGPISLKHAAALAGLGSIGRNTLLLTPELGNMVWLAAVLTSAPVEGTEAAEDAAAQAGGICPEGCSLCIDACPVGALGDPAMNQQACRMHAFPVVEGKLEIQCWRCRAVCPRACGDAVIA